ncbi:MAG TPA: SHOCT domain-containing protein [Anaerolineae bacterium]|nr:SHOCT domain-containing protein [Anaerolineae bacterium]
MMGFGFLWMGIFWLFIIGLGIWLLSALFPKTAFFANDAGESALAILNKRYARGELSKEEYETMRHELES